MSLPASTQRMTRPLLLIAVAVASIAFALWGVQRGVAASVGSAVAVGNWFAMRWLVARMFDGEGTNRAALGLLLVGKIGLLIAIVFVLISRVKLDPIGLAFGLGVLFVGPALAGVLSNLATTGSRGASARPASSHPAVSSAGEER
jgi:hypothetical protein